MALNDWSATSRTSASSHPGATRASVAMKPSIVAMFGRIIPAPLLMPVSVTRLPSERVTARLAPLGTVSVVMIASAAAAQPEGVSAAIARGSAASTFATGSGSRITPVEKGSTVSGGMASASATAVQVRSASRSPAAPVPAFATPVLITSARTRPAVAARWRRQISTGAAQKRFRVKTPAAIVPSSHAITVRSRRFALRIPASVVPTRTPGTASKVSG